MTALDLVVTCLWENQCCSQQLHLNKSGQRQCVRSVRLVQMTGVNTSVVHEVTAGVTGYSRAALGEAHAEQHVQARAVLQGSCAALPLPARSHFGVKLLLFPCHGSGCGGHSDLDHNTNCASCDLCIGRNCASWRDSRERVRLPDDGETSSHRCSN